MPDMDQETTTGTAKRERKFRRPTLSHCMESRDSGNGIDKLSPPHRGRSRPLYIVLLFAVARSFSTPEGIGRFTGLRFVSLMK